MMKNYVYENIMLMEAGHKNPVILEKFKALLDFSIKIFFLDCPFNSKMHMCQTSSTVQIM
jgi:hypothetical protein